VFFCARWELDTFPRVWSLSVHWPVFPLRTVTL
jgi:hypothetical protein